MLNQKQGGAPSIFSRSGLKKIIILWWTRFLIRGRTNFAISSILSASLSHQSSTHWHTASFCKKTCNGWYSMVEYGWWYTMVKYGWWYSMVDVRERLYDCSVALIVQQMARRRSREEGGDTRSYQLFNERPGRSRPILHNFWFLFSIDFISFFSTTVSCRSQGYSQGLLEWLPLPLIRKGAQHHWDAMSWRMADIIKRHCDETGWPIWYAAWHLIVCLHHNVCLPACVFVCIIYDASMCPD